MALVFTQTGIRLYTLKPDGTVKKQLADPSEFDKNRIGEFKKIEIDYQIATSLANVALFLDPALFMNIGGIDPMLGNQPTSYWGYTVDPAVTTGTFNMYLACPLPYNPNLIKNYQVQINVVSATDFTIIIKYFHLYDLNGYLDPKQESNHDKLLKDRSANTGELNVSGNSVYTTAEWRPVFYLYGKDTTTPTEFGYIKYYLNNYKAGFYAKNAHQAAPYFAQEQWILSRASGTVSDLSTLEDTKIRFRVSAAGCTAVYAWLIRTSTYDNTVDFLRNYDYSFANIVTLGFGTLHNAIKTPSTAPALVSGKWEVSFYVDKTQIDLGGKYRLIAIPYNDGNPVLTEVNSFISQELAVAYPSYTGALNITGKIKDYAGEYTGNDLVCVVEERLRSEINIDYGSDAFKNDIQTRLGITIPNDIRRYLTKITAEIYYDQTSSLRHYMARLVATKMDPVTYAVDSGLTLDFTTDNLLIKYDFRNRYEPGTPNIQSVYGGIPLLTPTSNQNWAGRVLKIKYSMELYYDDYATPFTDNLIFIQTIRPKGYEPDVVQIFKQDGETIGNAEYFCADVVSCFKAKFTGSSPELYKLITTVEPSPGAVSTIEEDEEWDGSVLPQLETAKIDSQETDFSETEAAHAKFCTLNSEFVLNLSYKISAIAKRVLPAEARITESGIARETEDGQLRITE